MQNTQAHRLHGGVKIERSMIVGKPANEVFALWRSSSHFPGSDTEIINEVQDHMISWQSTANSPLSQAGSIWLRESAQGRATEVRVSLMYCNNKEDQQDCELDKNLARTLEEDLSRLGGK